MGERIDRIKNEQVAIGEVTLTLLGIFGTTARVMLEGKGVGRKHNETLEFEKPHVIAPGVTVTLIGFIAAKMGATLDIVAPPGVQIGDLRELQSRAIAMSIARGMEKRGMRNGASVPTDAKEATDTGHSNLDPV